MKFHVKPKVVFHYVSRETSIQALLCTTKQIWLKSTCPHYDSQFNMLCRLQNLIDVFNVLTSTVTDTKQIYVQFRPIISVIRFLQSWRTINQFVTLITTVATDQGAVDTPYRNGIQAAGLNSQFLIPCHPISINRTQRATPRTTHNRSRIRPNAIS